MGRDRPLHKWTCPVAQRLFSSSLMCSGKKGIFFCTGAEVFPPHRALSQLIWASFLKGTPCLVCVVPNSLFSSGAEVQSSLPCSSDSLLLLGFFFPSVFPKPALKLEPAWGAVSMS